VADRRLADQEAGLPRRTASADAGERKSIWPFRRRPADERPTAQEPPEPSAAAAEELEVSGTVAEMADQPVERSHGIDADLDDGERTVLPLEPVGGDELEAEDDHAPVADIGVADAVDADVGELRAADPAGDHQGGVEGADDDHDQVEELFARLKADREPPARGAADGNETLGVGATAVAVIDEPQDSADVAVAAGNDDADDDADAEAAERDPDAAVLRDRDTHLGPVERELGRRLKRVLADEQNEVFDLLRRDLPASLDDVVPAAAEHGQRYAAAALPDLDVAALSGAASVNREVRGSCTALANELGRSLVEPMRERIARSFDECDGDLEEVTERLRSLYREWKGQRIGAAVRHYAAAAYAWGVYEATPSDAELRWLVDRSGEACPDADDNALASGVRKGEAFPTGVLCSPAHPDCRCLVVPVGVGGESGGSVDAPSGRSR
jgi:hypothetical protein